MGVEDEIHLLDSRGEPAKSQERVPIRMKPGSWPAGSDL